MEAAHGGRDGRVGVLAASLALVLLLASTWILVALALQDAPVALVSAGRSVFVVAGLGVLSAFAAGASRSPGAADEARERTDPLSPRTVIALALTGVSGYTIASTAAIALAGPDMPALILTLGPAVVMALEASTGTVRAQRSEVVAILVAVVATALYVALRPAGGEGGGHPLAGAA
ncbi:hypothetical protein DEO23_02390 [Brachybacterium endophyticum]|uniref:EamA domain-containing protein n=1 Tax=Brachybacterium endophyticum TaxID=2182385 RepID=A0A2U2RNP2_9MICO|nr:hypothetical protein DEO23_02390 [Brachybacterium endophyticum]